MPSKPSTEAGRNFVDQVEAVTGNCYSTEAYCPVTPEMARETVAAIEAEAVERFKAEQEAARKALAEHVCTVAEQEPEWVENGHPVWLGDETELSALLSEEAPNAE